MDSVSFLNSLLDQLDEKQDAEAWKRDKLPTTGAVWWYARHGDGRIVSVFIQAVVHDSYTVINLGIQYPMQFLRKTVS